MPLDPTGGGIGDGATFLISAYGVYEVIAANCSSPQTAELNADKRAETLMKWVYMGLAQSAFLVTVACLIQPKATKPIVAGAVLAGGIMWFSYAHAKASGLANPGPPTEQWGTTQGPS
jgi:hypothetical protein